MLKSLNHIRIVTGCITIFFCMLTATLVFATEGEVITKKSYYIPPTANNKYIEKNVNLVSTMKKSVTIDRSDKTYNLKIVKGNVYQVDIETGEETKVYYKGNAKYLAEVNFYFYDAAYTLIITEDGSLYANIYKNGDTRIKFRKVNTDFKITELKVLEKELKFYEYPNVALYGQSGDGNWKIIKL